MKRITALWLILAITNIVVQANGEAYIVEEGEPRAKIIIAEEPPRLVDLAARELQEYIKKISGAELPIGTAPSDEWPVSIFIGETPYTDELDITAEGLSESAFRIVSGPDYLAVVGRDVDFEPIEPAVTTVAEREEVQEEWRKLSGFDTRAPANHGFKDFHRPSGLWPQDESGSLQGVYQFLRDLGVRWYMPGDLGEVVPEMASIPLPEVDLTVAPDMPVRDLRLGNPRAFTMDEFLWYWRLGLNRNNLGGTHGMRILMDNDEWRENHPEFYALFGNDRLTHSTHACFSNEELLEKTIEWVRFVIDHYDKPVVNIMPEDGYRHCGCELCADRKPSDVVWEFVNEVAKAIYESHPDCLISGGAYTAYQEAPDSIDKFSPNVVARISWFRPGLDDPDQWATFQESVERWTERIGPQRLARNANVSGIDNPRFPLFFPRSIAHEYQSLRDDLLGENSSVPRRPGARWGNVGLSHLNIYTLSRYLWAADQDVDELLDEYFALFYGPAADQMQEAFDFMEASYSRVGRASRGNDLNDTIRFTELLEAARETAGDTVYGERIDLILSELMPVEELRAELEAEALVLAGRDDNPILVAADATRDQEPQTYRLIEMETGESPEIETRFTVVWEGDAMVFDIYCEEPDMENMPVTPDVWGGDSVALLLETPEHSYYQIEINPDGAVFDADREHGRIRGMENWSSEVEVETEKGEDYWRVVARVPVVSYAEGRDDPLHFVVGSKPSTDAPWYFNLGRSRGGGATERQRFLFSPTEEPGTNFHVVEKFGRLVIE